ncbi:TPA: hypothetical protein ACF00A_002921 [Acinetobacter nosocomialis]|nr:hypothetical protein [Acinetobacter nosocomialis]
MKNIILLLLCFVGFSANAGDVKGSFDIFVSASKLWQTCVSSAVDGYAQTQSSADEIASASLSSCEDKEELVYESMVNFQNSLSKNQNKTDEEIRQIVNGEIIEYRNTVKRNAVKRAIDISKTQQQIPKSKSSIYI